MKKLILLILLSGNALASDWALNLSIASKHFRDPDCEQKNRYCQYALEHGYNESNPGLNVEWSIDEGSTYLVGGFFRNSFDEMSAFGGSGVRFIRRCDWSIAAELLGVSNHATPVMGGFVVTGKYFKIGYMPKIGNSSDVVTFQYRIGFD